MKSRYDWSHCSRVWIAVEKGETWQRSVQAQEDRMHPITWLEDIRSYRNNTYLSRWELLLAKVHIDFRIEPGAFGRLVGGRDPELLWLSWQRTYKLNEVPTSLIDFWKQTLTCLHSFWKIPHLTESWDSCLPGGLARTNTAGPQCQQNLAGIDSQRLRGSPWDLLWTNSPMLTHVSNLQSIHHLWQRTSWERHWFSGLFKLMTSRRVWWLGDFSERIRISGGKWNRHSKIWRVFFSFPKPIFYCYLPDEN